MDIVAIDEQATIWLNGFYTDTLDSVFWYISWKYTWFLVGALMLWYLFKEYGPRRSLIFLLFVAVMVLATDQLCNVFKHSVQRYRPCWDSSISDMVHIVNNDRGGKYGFFSAHAAIFFGLAYMTSRLFRKRGYTIGVYIVAVLVAYSRIYLGRHYLGDVMVGAMAGTLVAWAAWHFHEKFRDKLLKTHKRQKNLE